MVDVTSMLEAADRNVQFVSTPSEAQRAADDILKIASSYSVGRFVAASPTAAPLAATVTEAFQCTGLEHCDPLSTVLLDINFASGTEFSRAAVRARQEGASVVVGLALYQLAQTGPTAEECGLDALVFVHADVGQPDEAVQDRVDLRTSGLGI